ncbi:MAG: hypothetical protein WDZ35_00075 [Crocinitomicaceae bacterium]
MKLKVIILNSLMMIFFSSSLLGQTAAVADVNTRGVQLTPEIAAKLLRLELIKTEKYKVLDRFDMEAVLGDDKHFENCYGKNCLEEMGKSLEVDYIFSGSIDAFAGKLLITIKVINVNQKQLYMTKTMEFEDHPNEISRMFEVMLKEMHGLAINEETKKRLLFKNDPILSNNVGRINNSGPRFGISYAGFGELPDFFRRDSREGGLESVPLMSNIGYQFEMQYVGTENFSALFEIIPNIGGLEQGNFIPTISLLNGFRFGQSGWEFAFGPNFGARRMLSGIQTEEGFVGKEDYLDAHHESWGNDPSNYNPVTGSYYDDYKEPNENWIKRLDTRGDLEFNTNWLMGFGRTFRLGSLNIPVNIYYSGNKYGGVIGSSVGFNVIKKKESIHRSF